MIIPKNKLKRWNNMREHGDIVTLAKELDVHEVTLSRVFKTGNCSLRLAEKINAFYKARQSKIKAITIDDNN